MRPIGTLPNESQARLFGDFLLTQGIRAEVEAEPDATWLIWVLDDEQLAAASVVLERFRRNPTAPEFAREAAAADSLRAAEAQANQRWRQRFFNRKRAFPGSQSFGAGPLTFTLIVACVGLGLASKFGTDETFLKPFFISYDPGGRGGLLPEVRAGEFWRLFTPALIHFGPMHLLFNMMWLFQLGSMIEGLQGRVRFSALVLVIAIVSNVAQYLVGGPGFGGMSGVVYGLFGYVWLRGKLDPASGLFIDPQSVVLMIVWFVLCFTGMVGPIANTAHTGGLVLGAAWGALSGWWARRNPV